MKKISKHEYLPKLNPHLLTLLDFPEEIIVEEIKPIDLIFPERIDVLIKYLYLKYKIEGIEVEWPEKFYRQHISNWSRAKESDISGKDSIDKYFESFNQVFHEISNSGFEEDKSLLPIDESGLIIDGSHRLACCLALKKPVKCIRIPGRANVYNWEYFSKKGLAEDILDEAVLEYIRLKKNTYLICIFPIIKNKKLEFIRNVVLENCKIVYEKDINLSLHGMRNFITQLYKGETWLGNEDNGYQGALNSAKQRYSNNATKLFFIECKNCKLIRQLKENIREYYHFGNSSVHINDAHEETIRISEQVLNKNSIFFLNNANPFLYKDFISELGVYRNILNDVNFYKNDFVIDSGSVMAVFGLRNSRDIDYLNIKNDTTKLELQGYDSHNNEIRYHHEIIDKLIYDPTFYFYYDGLKFLTLDIVYRMKKKRGEEKDIRDCLLINDYLKKETDNFRPNTFKKDSLHTRIINHIKKTYPNYVLSFLRIALRFYYYIKRGVTILSWYFLPKNKYVFYKGFNVYVNRNNSLLGRFANSGTYESELTAAIYKEILCRKKTPVNFIDIGANIGLISFNILSQFPDTHILAFEPGRLQRKMFEKTITTNNLERHINLLSYALADYSGEAEFRIHNSRYNSGDGLVDTGRSGETRIENVQVERLDDLLCKENIKSIDFIKIDAEGAELLILKGSVDTLKKDSPIIFFELHKENLKVYPYDEHDLLEFFHEHNYEVKNVFSELVTRSNIKRMMEKTEDFIAYPSKNGQVLIN